MRSTWRTFKPVNQVMGESKKTVIRRLKLASKEGGGVKVEEYQKNAIMA